MKKHPILVIVLNCIAIVVLCALLFGAIVLHQNGQLGQLFSGVISFGLSDDFFAADDSYQVGNGSLSAQEITDLDLNWATGTVNLQVGEGEEIILSETASRDLEEKEQMRWKAENGKLTIRYCRRDGLRWFSFGKKTVEKDLTLTIPATLAEKLEDVKVSTASGELSVKDVKVNHLRVDMASGKVSLYRIVADSISVNSASGSLYGEALVTEDMDLDSASGKKTLVDCVVSGCLRIDSASGNCSFSGTLNELDYDSASGDLDLTLTAAAKILDIDSASANVTIRLPSDLPGFSVDMDSASGDLEIDFPVTYQSKHKAVYGDGSMQVEIDSASGDVRFKMN